MKLYILITLLFISILLFGLTRVANADPPTPDGATQPEKGSSGPAQTQPARVVLDRTTATVTQLELAEEIRPLSSGVNGNQVPQQIGPTAVEVIKYEDFEGDFPNNWEFFDANGPTGGEQLWTDVPCFPRTGSWSGWPAGLDGANGVDPCSPNFSNYPNDVNAWLIYGPFSLVGAQSASFNIYLKMVAELCDPIDLCDFLFWGASTDGDNFDGVLASGTFTGSFGNGYDRVTLDLANVPTGPTTTRNLLGQSQVWIALLFKSDFSETFSGPFIDDVSVIFEPAAAPSLKHVFLPIVIKSPPPVTPKTNLYVFNNTGGIINYYRVFGSKLNGVPIPDISCNNIAPGATQFCGTVDTGTYFLKFEGAKCTLQATKTLQEGNHTREARCPS